MRHNKNDFPRPVLSDFGKDFIGCSFSLKLNDHNDNGDTIQLFLECDLKSEGLKSLLDSGSANAIVRVTCFRTSFRCVYKVEPDYTLTISLKKRDVVDLIDVQGMIVAAKAIPGYYLKEFNHEYFGDNVFNLRKGDILATEPGFKIQLNSILEKDAAGIVQIRVANNITSLRAHYASIEEDDPSLTNYIYIDLPDKEYVSYAKLRTKKHMKNGIERFLQASIVLPAITEGISKIRMEEMLDEDESDEHYKGTTWADSILAAVQREYNVDSISDTGKTDFEIANCILGGIVGDSINNLCQKMEEWSTIRQEDENL